MLTLNRATDHGSDLGKSTNQDGMDLGKSTNQDGMEVNLPSEAGIPLQGNPNLDNNLTTPPLYGEWTMVQKKKLPRKRPTTVTRPDQAPNAGPSSSTKSAKGQNRARQQVLPKPAPKPPTHSRIKASVNAAEAMSRIQDQLASGKSWKRARTYGDDIIDKVLARDSVEEEGLMDMVVDRNSMGRPPDKGEN